MGLEVSWLVIDTSRESSEVLCQIGIGILISLLIVLGLSLLVVLFGNEPLKHLIILVLNVTTEVLGCLLSFVDGLFQCFDEIGDFRLSLFLFDLINIDI